MNNGKLWLWVVIVNSLTLPFFAEARALEDIKRSKKLVVGMATGAYPPFYYQDTESGKKVLKGYDIDLVKKIGNRLGVQTEIVRNTRHHSELGSQLLNDKVDIVVSSYRTTLPRAESIAFSEPYFFEKSVFVVHRKHDQLRHQRTRKQRQNSGMLFVGKVGVFSKKTYGLFLQRRHPKLKQIIYQNMAKMISGLKNGNLQFAYLGQSVIDNWLHHNPQDVLYLKKYSNPREGDSIGIGVNPKYGHLLRWMNLFIAIEKKRGSLKRLQARHFKKFGYTNFKLDHDV